MVNDEGAACTSRKGLGLKDKKRATGAVNFQIEIDVGLSGQQAVFSLEWWKGETWSSFGAR